MINPLKGAIPVPAAIMMIGVSTREGNRNLLFRKWIYAFPPLRESRGSASSYEGVVFSWVERR